MASLYTRIRSAIRRGKVVFSLHADNRLQQRRVVRWQVVEGFDAGELLEAVESAKPNPKILVRQWLADGTEVIAVWSYLDCLGAAKLVTVYYEEQR